MRFILRFILIAGLSYLSLQYLGWWSVVVVAFAVGFLLSERRVKRLFGKKKRPALAFLAGFLSLFLLWGGMALYLNTMNESILSTKIADLIFQSGVEGRGQLLILISASLGGLLGGLGAMTGNLLGEAMKS